MGALMGQLPEAAQEKVRPLFRIFSGMMLMSDPPDHTRLRALSNKAFTPRVVERMREDIQTVVDSLLDEVEQKGEMDVIRDIAFPLPSTVIAEMLGIRPEDREQFKKWSADITSFLGNVRVVAETVGSAQKSSLELSEYLKDVIAQLRVEPKENLLSALVAVEEHGDTFSEEELYSMCILLIFAGHETTTNLLGNGLYHLLRHPDQYRKLRDRPGLIKQAVEECLRYDGPVPGVVRIVAEDMEFQGIDNNLTFRRLQAEGKDVVLTSGVNKMRAHMRSWMRYFEEVPTQAIRVPTFNALLVARLKEMGDEKFAAITDAMPVRKQFYRRMKLDQGGFSERDSEDARQRLRSTLEHVNDAVKDSNWICGELFTLADVTLMPTVVRLEDLGMASMWDDLPAVAAWYERVQGRPTFAKTYHPGTRVGA
ncbi:MAG: cytochrome P450 [Proteobacteria bacterium]|nr:cytochrome P450 [Pseudomonadota bacterium]